MGTGMPMLADAPDVLSFQPRRYYYQHSDSTAGSQRETAVETVECRGRLVRRGLPGSQPMLECTEVCRV
jgi:hypothetical protein